MADGAITQGGIEGLEIWCVSVGQPEVKLCRSTLWLPFWAHRTPWQNVMHCWSQSHAGVSQGQPEVKMIRYALWAPNLVGRT